MTSEQASDVVWFTPGTEWSLVNHASRPNEPGQSLCWWSGRPAGDFEAWRPRCGVCQRIADREAAR